MAKTFKHLGAIDKNNETVNFYLSRIRDTFAAKFFFEDAIQRNMLPEQITMDKYAANVAGWDMVNQAIPEHYKSMLQQIKYLNNNIEQDHRAIKRIVNPMPEFKFFNSAVATLAGIEICHMIKKGQHQEAVHLLVWQQFYCLM